MGRVRTVTRRAFLIGSTAVMGGVAFGSYMVARPHENPLVAGLQNGEATFNPFVKITNDAITLIVPHADKGQGCLLYTSPSPRDRQKSRMPSSA